MEVIKLKHSFEHSKQFCYICFSTDRRLSSIEKYIDSFYKLSKSSCVLTADMMICWECVEMLKKFKQFQLKVDKAQRLYNCHLYKQDTLPSSLSNLKITNLDPERVIRIDYDEIEVNTQTDIKEEIDDNHDCSNVQEQGDDDDVHASDDLKYSGLIDDFKTEDGDVNILLTSDGIKNELAHDKRKVKRSGKTNRRSKMEFRYMNKITLCDIYKLTEAVHVDCKEIKCWMEKQRLDSSYKSLKFRCESCVLGWVSQRAFDKHNSKYHGVSLGTYECELCLSRFASPDKLSKHAAQHFTLRKCPTCGHTCSAQHMCRHLGLHGSLVQCGQCKAKFLTLQEFYAHYKDLHDQFVCDLCGKRARSKHVLEKHMVHHYEKFECKICDRKYSSKDSYKRHVQARHGLKNEAAYCVQCDKQYTHTAEYKRHLASSTAHAAERDHKATGFACPVCDRLYSRRQYMLNHHMHVHLKKTKYYCNHCDKYFLNRSRHLNHMQYTHEGMQRVKNKICNICGRGFAVKRTLINHIRTHSGERPYECAYCDAKFTQQYAMVTHARHVHMRVSRRRWRAGADADCPK